VTSIRRPGRNIELKARDVDPRRSLASCESLGAVDRGELVQRDTYFEVARGRLKLREEDGSIPHLISYARADVSTHRESRYRIVEVGDPDGLKAALASTLGIKAVVAKRRRLFVWEGNVRIHLDRVEDLGDFIEFEAVAAADSDLSGEEGQVSRLWETFGIEGRDVLGASYCDLMVEGDSASGRHSVRGG
jgi:adenylate cyclase, class 2